MYFSTRVLNQGDLTPREAQVMECICSAMTDKQIARTLAISTSTIAHHIDHIHEKLGIRQEILNKRVALLRVALARGLVCVPAPGGSCD